jgi:surfactin synthase thioesterase subunit
LIEEVARHGGFTVEILNHPELMELLMPRLRSDFTLFETYTNQKRTPLSCPITAFAGQADKNVQLDSVEAWQSHTMAKFQLEPFPCGHFF